MRKKIYNKLIFLIILSFILNACYSTETVGSKVLLRKSVVSNFEIQIPIHHEGRGNIHTLDISKYEFDDSHWIYINTKKGKLEASDIILTYYNGKTEFPWKQSNTKGYIEFLNDSLLIHLKIPNYKDDNDKPESWVDYRFNGKYLIELINK